jgi:hypothetical protein
MKSVTYKKELILVDNTYGKLFNIDNFNNFDRENKYEKDFDLSMVDLSSKYNNKEYYDLYLNSLEDYSLEELKELKGNLHKYQELLQEKYNDFFFQDIINFSLKKFEESDPKAEEQYVPLYNENNICIENEYNKFVNNNIYSIKKSMFIDNSSSLINNVIDTKINYLLITPN